MIALSIALVILGGLAYDLARKVIVLKQPVPPHDALVARVKSLEDRVQALMAHGGFEVPGR